MTSLPESTTYAVVGAGIHGLSTAWHLAKELEARGTGSGHDILVLDKTGPGAGATGIACGCVRNFYMTEPLHAILRHSVDVWMHDPIGFGFQQVGYVSCGEANQIEDYARIHKSQNAVGYPSDLHEGKNAHKFLKSIWPDFKTERVGVVIHEKISGYAGTRQTVAGFAEKCRRHGVRILSGIEVTGYDLTSGQVSKLHTNRGDLACDAVVLGLGAWTPKHWEMLDLPPRIDVGVPGGVPGGAPDGEVETDRDMWTFWRLLEGDVLLDTYYRDAQGFDPPVLHVELMNTPVIDQDSGKELDDHLYVYWKNAAERLPDRIGVQGGTIPVRIGPKATVDPYGHANRDTWAEPAFADYFTSALAQLMGRFEGCRKRFHARPNGGIGAFTPDNVPIFDWILPNVYMIADSNHGFKMAGVGKLVANLLATGRPAAELEPFALSRFAEGRSFGASNSHCPWV